MSALQEKKAAFDSISWTLGVIRMDIKHHQAINDQSLNIFSENFFKDIFNFISLGSNNYIDANLEEENAAFVDLVDLGAKKLIQITSTRTLDKIKRSLNALKLDKYKNFELQIYYLIDKANPNADSFAQLKSDFGEEILEKVSFRDSEDLLKEINDLTNEKIVELKQKYFDKQSQRYTNEKVLNLACMALIDQVASIAPNYDEDFGSLDSNTKIRVNSINTNIASRINNSLDYAHVIDRLESDEIERLRGLVVDDYYAEVLHSELKITNLRLELDTMSVEELQIKAIRQKVDFNKITTSLTKRIESELLMTDFNSLQISWIIVSFFFEICDVGGRRIDPTF